jgi:FkbM family methyltransferase
MEINGWEAVEIFPVAFSDKPGLLRLYGSGTGTSLISGWAQASGSKHIVVPVCTLDRILGPSLDEKRVLFWIDVEGAEFQVLLGGLAQLDRTPSPTWVAEITIDAPQPAGRKVNPFVRDIFELFRNHGYTARNLDAGSLVTSELVNKWHAGEDLIGGGNFVFDR